MRNTNRALIVFTLAAMALAVASPIIATGSWYNSHDNLRYPYLLTEFARAMAEGILYPRWMPDMMGGYGYPIFVFYQPGFFYAGAFWYALLGDAVHACYANIWMFAFAGAGGTYLLARKGCGVVASLIVAGLFLLTHYVLVNLYVRGDLSEMAAMMTAPWGLWALLRLSDRHDGASVLALAVAVAAQLLMHPFFALFYLPLLAGLLLVLALARRDALLFYLGALAFAGAVTVTAPYWFTLWQMKDTVKFTRALEGGYNVLKSLGKWFPIIVLNPLKTQFWLMALALAGFAAGWKHTHVRYLAVAYAFLIFMMTTPSRPVWEFGYPVLKFVQFPWRLLGVTAVLQAVGIMHLAAWLEGRDRRYRAAGIALVLAVVLMVNTKPAKVATLDYAAQVHLLEERGTFVSMTILNEFLPQQAQVKELQNRLLRRLPIAWAKAGEDTGGIVKELPESTPYRIRFTASMDARGEVLINQLWLPGWRVYVNGQDVPFSESVLAEGMHLERDAKGRILLMVEEGGEYAVEAWYEGPPGWRTRNLVMAAMLTVLGLAYYKRVAVLRFCAKSLRYASHRQNAA